MLRSVPVAPLGVCLIFPLVVFGFREASDIWGVCPRCVVVSSSYLFAVHFCLCYLLVRGWSGVCSWCPLSLFCERLFMLCCLFLSQLFVWSAVGCAATDVSVLESLSLSLHLLHVFAISSSSACNLHCRTHLLAYYHTSFQDEHLFIVSSSFLFIRIDWNLNTANLSPPPARLRRFLFLLLLLCCVVSGAHVDRSTGVPAVTVSYAYVRACVSGPVRFVFARC